MCTIVLAAALLASLANLAALALKRDLARRTWLIAAVWLLFASAQTTICADPLGLVSFLMLSVSAMPAAVLGLIVATVMKSTSDVSSTDLCMVPVTAMHAAPLLLVPLSIRVPTAPLLIFVPLAAQTIHIAWRSLRATRTARA